MLKAKLTSLKVFFKSGRKRWLALAMALVILIAALIGLGWYNWSGWKLAIPTAAQVQAGYHSSEGFLLDRNGATLQQVRLSFQGRRAEWARLDEISPALITAVIQAEDQRFYEHHGVDWRALVGAASHGFASGSWRGASTITMQLASMLFPELGPHSTRRTIGQKFEQICLARRLEASWQKREILEAYLNLVSYRGELEGISAASLGLFGKKPYGLNTAEAAILAALVRSPNAVAAQVATRASLLTEKLGAKIPQPDLEKLCLQSFKPVYHLPLEYNDAPHVARILFASNLNQKGTFKIRSTLDASLQRTALELLRRQLLELKDRNVQDGAVVVIDNESGEVLAYVGSGGDLSSAAQVDGVQAPRQAGSSLKPFLYGLAIDKRLLTAASLLDDSPLEIPQPNGIYKPENYDHQFHGSMTVRIALASSINIPAVRTLQLVGVEPFLDKLIAMDFRDLKPAGYYGPSLALGSADITLWDLANGYRALANRGNWTPLRLNMEVEAATNSRYIFSPAASFIIGDILSDRESRSSTFGLENPLATPFWTAVKTGTSKDMRDNWCVGFSRRYTVGVWMGNFSGAPMWNVMGVTGAAPLWAELMRYLHNDVPSTPPPAPAGMISQMTEIPSLGIRRQEWFLPQTEMEVVEKRTSATKSKITSPANGESIAWDPDIPAEQQKLFFEAQPPSAEFAWELDGQRIGTAERLIFWTPVAGPHTLKLLNEAGEAIDSVQFIVKGGPPPAHP